MAFVFLDYFVFFDCAREIEAIGGMGFVEIFVALKSCAGVKAHEWNL